MLWTWAIIVTFLFVLSVALNVKTIRQNLVLSDQRENLADQIEESLDVLDTCYSRVSHHAEVPVLSDEPIVQDVVRDIRLARNAILAVASKVVTYGSPDGRDREDDQD